ncbi:MAG: DUF2169 domain-containing protein [Gammaproteobacteria bacterium]|nr:DUF2169 domain-containing protein [Gammaproteobacteria bacterium]
MPHPEIQNRTSFSFEPILVQDENGRSIFGVIAKSTLALEHNGKVTLANAGPVSLKGEMYDTDGEPWYKYEPETAFVKLTTDVVLIGHASSFQSGTKKIDVGIRCGPVAKRATVFGDRYWVVRNGAIAVTTPQPFERIPLTYDRAFGGWDKSDKDPEKYRWEPRNPVGTGFGKPLRGEGERLRLPNIENPEELLSTYGQVVTPTGFGFVSPSWQSRAQYAGTYDSQWEATRKPLLPSDFDRRYFNAASPGLISPQFLQGNEQIDIVNASPVPHLKFQLPGFPPPSCLFEHRDARQELIAMNLDTVIVDTDVMRVYMIWRAHTVVRDGAHSIVGVTIDCNHPAAKRRRPVD